MTPEEFWMGKESNQVNTDEAFFILMTLTFPGDPKPRFCHAMAYDDVAYARLKQYIDLLLGEGWDKKSSHRAPDPESELFREKVKDMWPKNQPGGGGPVPPSCPKAKLNERWDHWVKVKHVDPPVLYLACWKYLQDFHGQGSYIKSMMNFLSPSRKMVPDFLDWAKAEALRQKQAAGDV